MSLHDIMSTRVDNSGLPEGRPQSQMAPKELIMFKLIETHPNKIYL